MVVPLVNRNTHTYSPTKIALESGEISGALRILSTNKNIIPVITYFLACHGADRMFPCFPLNNVKKLVITLILVAL